MDRSTHIKALVQLGRVMAPIGAGKPWPGHSCGSSEAEYKVLDAVVRGAHVLNGWSTEENVRHAFAAWASVLTEDALRSWVANYPEASPEPRTIGLVLAGNIPLVGLHDVLCVWLCDHKARIKCSSQDPELIPALIDVLDHFMPGTKERIVCTTGKLGEVDAVIATGSNNTARYFEHYFGHLPRIVRKSRVSLAVLDGSETAEELAALGEDIFRYFGLGCRNVAKLYLPKDFELNRIFEALFPWKDIVHHNKYANNYDYTRALWMLDKVNFLENGFVLFKEDKALPSPVGTVFYERYTDPSELSKHLAEHAGSIQCVVGHGQLPFGSTQVPGLADYADNVDTLRFLLDLK